MRIAEGDLVLLYFSERRRYLVRAEGGKRLNLNEGIVDLGEMVGREYGCELRTHTGVRFLVLRPNLLDLVMKFRRVTQIVYPKDAARIVSLACVGPGARVVEAGMGSGALTAVLAYHVRPTGVVYSYEVREDFARVAMRNLKMAGLSEYVRLKLKDIREGIDESGVDAVVLDMPEPWEVVDHAYTALRHGGSMVCFLPTINQVERAVEAMRGRGFVDVGAIEIIERRYKVARGETRPETIMVGHTGYIVHGRRP